MKKLILLITVIAFWGCDNSTEATDSCENVDCSNLTVGCEVGVCENGECMVQNSQTGTVCDDDNACTSNDACNGQGTCLSGQSLECNDAISCTVDTCHPITGCIYTPDDTFCDDSNVCTEETCNETTGCISSNNNNFACDDGDDCTSNDTCNQGACVAGQQIPNCP